MPVNPNYYQSDWGRQNLQMQPPPGEVSYDYNQPQGISALQRGGQLLGGARNIVDIGSKFGKFGGAASKLSKATPWGIGGTAAGIAGKLIGKRNYRTGGALSGAGAGAATGAAIGSFLPGPGTVIGGVLGGLVGGIKGFFGGKKRKEQQHQLDLQKQREEDENMFSNLQATYGGGRMNRGAGAASSEAQSILNQQSPEDQAAILKSFGNRDALDEWAANVKANWAKDAAAKAAPPPARDPYGDENPYARMV